MENVQVRTLYFRNPGKPTELQNGFKKVDMRRTRQHMHCMLAIKMSEVQYTKYSVH